MTVGNGYVCSKANQGETRRHALSLAENCGCPQAGADGCGQQGHDQISRRIQSYQTVPGSKIATARRRGADTTNCGISARKNRAVLGFRTSVAQYLARTDFFEWREVQRVHWFSTQ